jgi:hypothetical protein
MFNYRKFLIWNWEQTPSEVFVYEFSKQS